MLRCVVPVILLAFAPLPALANDADAMRQAISFCFATEGDVEALTERVKSDGWTAERDEETGLVNFFTDTSANTFGFIATDGSFCHAESMTLSSEDTAMILQEVVAEYEYDFDKDDMGCTMLSFAGFGSATITSGGQDPICGAENNSAVRFNFE